MNGERDKGRSKTSYLNSRQREKSSIRRVDLPVGGRVEAGKWRAVRDGLLCGGV